MLWYAVESGPQHDYKHYLSQWTLVLSGEDPWSTNNTYGPLHNVSALLLLLGVLGPKMMTAIAVVAANAFLVNQLILTNDIRHEDWDFQNAWIFFYVIAVPANVLIISMGFAYGLNDTLVAALVVAAIIARHRGLVLVAGASLGLAALLKYYPVFLIHLFALENWRFRPRLVVGAAAVFLVGFSAAVWIWGDAFLVSFDNNVARGPKLFSILAALKSHQSLFGGAEIVDFLIIINAVLVVLSSGLSILIAWILRLHWIEAAVMGLWIVFLTYKVGHQQFYIPWLFLVAALPLAGTRSSQRLAVACVPFILFVSVFQFGYHYVTDQYREILGVVRRDVGLVAFFLGLSCMSYYFAYFRRRPALSTGAESTPTNPPSASISRDGLGGSGYRWPAVPLVMIVTATLAAAAGFAWLQRGQIFPVARAVLIEQTRGAGVTGLGTATWELIDAQSIRATVEFPDSGLSLTMTITPNTDETLPASHLIEVVTVASPTFAGRGVAAIAGLIVKPRPQISGHPLSGAVAEVGDNTFWIALSSSDPDRLNNLKLLRSWPVFELPFEDWAGQRGSVLFEKGRSGERVFEAAFLEWAGE